MALTFGRGYIAVVGGHFRWGKSRKLIQPKKEAVVSRIEFLDMATTSKEKTKPEMIVVTGVENIMFPHVSNETALFMGVDERTG
jgi:hypothetical protein